MVVTNLFIFFAIIKNRIDMKTSIKSKKQKILLSLLTATIIIGGAIVYATKHENYSPVKVEYTRSTVVGEGVIVKFSKDVGKEKAKNLFSISPEIKGQLSWNGEEKELYFVPEEGFNTETEYTVRVGISHSFVASLLNQTEKKVFSPESLPVKRHVRVEGKDTIWYITESGLRRPMTKEAFLSYKNNDISDIETIDEETLKMYPKNTLIHLANDHRVYKLEEGKKRLIKNARTFNMLELEWEAIAPVNEAEFNSFTSGESVDLAYLPHRKAARGKFIDVNLQTMETTLYNNGNVVKKFPVAAKGNPWRHPTRKGLYNIKNKERNHLSSLYNVWMPYAMQYSGNYFIHGWPYYPGGRRVQSNYSGGCIRVSQENAKFMLNWTTTGTPIFVHS